MAPKKTGNVTLEIDIPEIKAEVETAFSNYERALVNNDACLSG